MSVGNGVMAAFGAKDEAQVERVYKLALSLGGSCPRALPARAAKISMPPISVTPRAISSTPS